VYRVVIDTNTCIGSSNCAEEAPDAYEVDEHGIARLRRPLAPDEDLLRGAQACPVDAIRLYDAQTGALLHP
jgi:ferredoxin